MTLDATPTQDLPQTPTSYPFQTIVHLHAKCGRATCGSPALCVDCVGPALMWLLSGSRVVIRVVPLVGIWCDGSSARGAFTIMPASDSVNLSGLMGLRAFGCYGGAGVLRRAGAQPRAAQHGPSCFGRRPAPRGCAGWSAPPPARRQRLSASELVHLSGPVYCQYTGPLRRIGLIHLLGLALAIQVLGQTGVALARGSSYFPLSYYRK